VSAREDRARSEAQTAADKTSSKVSEDLAQYRKELLFTGANAALISSTEFANRQIEPAIRLYYAALARCPDYTGLQNWSNALSAGVLTLTGAAGSASITVDTGFPGRMETSSWNYVTLPSSDLGALQSITVQRDCDGAGPDWFLDRISVESVRGARMQAVFDCWVGSGRPLTKPLAAIEGDASAAGGTT